MQFRVLVFSLSLWHFLVIPIFNFLIFYLHTESLNKLSISFLLQGPPGPQGMPGPNGPNGKRVSEYNNNIISTQIGKIATFSFIQIKPSTCLRSL